MLITRVLEDSLHFANARKLQELLLKLESLSAIPVKGIVLNLEHLVELYCLNKYNYSFVAVMPRLLFD